MDLIKAVLEQINDDVGYGDYSAIEELLLSVPRQKLIGFLPESLWERYK